MNVLTGEGREDQKMKSSYVLLRPFAKAGLAVLVLCASARAIFSPTTTRKGYSKHVHVVRSEAGGTVVNEPRFIDVCLGPIAGCRITF